MRSLDKNFCGKLNIPFISAHGDDFSNKNAKIFELFFSEIFQLKQDIRDTGFFSLRNSINDMQHVDVAFQPLF